MSLLYYTTTKDLIYKYHKLAAARKILVSKEYLTNRQNKQMQGQRCVYGRSK